MKKTLPLLVALMSVAHADNWFNEWMDDASDMTKAIYSDWHHNLPDTGLYPSFASFEFTSNMGERHGGSTLGWQQYGICIPLADPRKSGGGDMMFNASLNADVTFMDADGAFYLKRNELYNLTLPLAAIFPRQSGDTLVVAVAPTLASDFVHKAHSFHVNCMLTYSIKQSESFTYSIGIAHSPETTVWGLMPVFSFDWQMNDYWSMRMKGFRFSVMRDMGSGLELGPFVAAAGGSWAVDSEYGTRMLRVRSVVAGLAAEYDFSKEGETKRVLALNVGTTIVTAAELCRYNSDLDQEEGHHYHPGLFVSGSVDFRF